MAFRPYKPREYSSTKGVVTRAFDLIDGGAKHVAFLLHKSIAQTHAYADPATPEELTLDQARRLADYSAPVAALMADDFASFAGGVFLPLPPPDATDRFEGFAAEGAELCGTFVADVLRALSDGRVDTLEKRAIRPQLDRVIHALATARGKLTNEAG